MIKIVNGIQNHTRPIAAPVIIEAVGTTPRLRGGVRDGPASALRLHRCRAGIWTVSVTATMHSNLWTWAPRDTAFSREPGGG